jgi:hypothetical protein
MPLVGGWSVQAAVPRPPARRLEKSLGIQVSLKYEPLRDRTCAKEAAEQGADPETPLHIT